MPRGQIAIRSGFATAALALSQCSHSCSAFFGGGQMFEELLTYLISKVGLELTGLALPIAGAFAWAIIRLLWSYGQRAYDFIHSRRRALSAVARTQETDGPTEGPGVWTLKPIAPPENYKYNVQRARILAVANLKGGVGKTTIAANIGAYLADHILWRRRILLIDLDYQGSLSSMAFPEDNSWLPPSGTDSVATRALSGDLEPNLFLAACKEVHEHNRLRVITAHYDLAQADNRLLVEWLLNKRPLDRRSLRRWLSDLFAGRVHEPSEMRFNLAKLLHSEAVQDAFDLIIIDCPPRLTAGTIQALCCSSHVLIPTILDKPSSESVASFCEQVEALKSAGLCPHIRYVGAVATRYVATHIASRQAIQRTEDSLSAKGIRCGFLPESTFIPQTQSLVREASDGIAYYSLHGSQQASKARQAIANLAQHVAMQVGVAPAQYFGANENSAQLSLPEAAE
jgi:cellulose biosynthesis protein BcsQ